MKILKSLLPAVNVGDTVYVVYKTYTDNFKPGLPLGTHKSEGVVLNCVPHMLLKTWVYTILLENGILCTDALHINVIDEHGMTLFNGVNIEYFDSNEKAAKYMKSPLEFEMYKVYTQLNRTKNQNRLVLEECS